MVYVATPPRLGFAGSTGVIRAAFRRHGATAFGRPVRISGPTDRAFDPAIGADRHGDVVVAWTTRRSAEIGRPGVTRLFSATGHDGSYEHPRRVSARGENVRGGGPPILAVNANGAAILVWYRGHLIRAARLTG